MNSWNTLICNLKKYIISGARGGGGGITCCLSCFEDYLQTIFYKMFFSKTLNGKKSESLQSYHKKFICAQNLSSSQVYTHLRKSPVILEFKFRGKFWNFIWSLLLLDYEEWSNSSALPEAWRPAWLICLSIEWCWTLFCFNAFISFLRLLINCLLLIILSLKVS